MKKLLMMGAAAMVWQILPAYGVTEQPVTSLSEDAECVVPPSCESLGYKYSEYNCFGARHLVCPFDESKLYCLPAGKLKPGDRIYKGEVIGNVGTKMPGDGFIVLSDDGENLSLIPVPFKNVTTGVNPVVACGITSFYGSAALLRPIYWSTLKENLDIIFPVEFTDGTTLTVDDPLFCPSSEKIVVPSKTDDKCSTSGINDADLSKEGVSLGGATLYCGSCDGLEVCQMSSGVCESTMESCSSKKGVTSLISVSTKCGTAFYDMSKWSVSSDGYYAVSLICYMTVPKPE